MVPYGQEINRWPWGIKRCADCSLMRHCGELLKILRGWLSCVLEFVVGLPKQREKRFVASILETDIKF